MVVCADLGLAAYPFRRKRKEELSDQEVQERFNKVDLLYFSLYFEI